MILELRKPTENEIDKIRKYDEEGLSYYFNDPYTFDSGIIFSDSRDEILGAGIIRVLEEVRTVIDPKLDNFQKAKIVHTLIKNAIKRRRTHEILAFISKGGKDYANLLQNHFGFKVIDEDVIPMKLVI